YAWLLASTKEQYQDWDGYVKKTKPLIIDALIKEDIPFLEVNARAKHYYSLYKKLLKYDMDIAKISDIVALRVIVPTVADCYATLGAMHKFRRPIPGKIKDYIALPKPNGYRSLHTTIFGPDERPVEIQIRTVEMHEEAEHGIAAHWAYGEFKRSNASSYAKKQSSFADKKKVSWIEQLREWQKEFETPDEFLESLKIDFFKNRIFVLTPRGDVFDLPEESTPIDFAYRVHTDIGNTATGAKINGKMVGLDHLLKNGDVIQILTQKNKKPSRDWLTFVKSPDARKKVNAFLKKTREDQKFEKRKGEIVELMLTVRDRIGLIRDISNMLARQKISIKNITSNTQHRAYPALTIQAQFKNKTEVEKTMVKLKEIKGVEEVS
ncbi:TGS domain-containing protein, partial [Patescibacteria group bacterium]|nr:TGS domain-containing protein [Patescibacteria group bacterium]